MHNDAKPIIQSPAGPASLLCGFALLVWLIVLCFVPDPRPFGAPDWSVRGLRAVLGMSEPVARIAATMVLRGIGMGMIGLLLSMSLQHLRLVYAAPVILVATPLLALGVKWINFGYFPVMPQLQFILVLAVFGALAGLVLRRSRTALVVLVGLAVGLFAWGASTQVPDDLYEAARATGLHVLENTQDLPRGDDAFVDVLQMAFAYAQDNSNGTDAVLPNQAAILALGVILGEDRIAFVGRRELEPGGQKQRAALRRRVSVRGRYDLPQHFWVSAALTVLSDAQRALTVGIAKEMKDSTPGGSGFSFVDMGANKTGIRFAVAATRSQESARSIQLRIAQGLDMDDFFPDFQDLPEGMSDKNFQAEYGGLGSSRTQDILAEIDRRISACESLR